MRKIAFYPKLALGNLWRNRRSYLPYLLACVVSVFTFYTMVAINSNGALNGLRGETVVKSFTAIGTIILAIFCSILIFYTNGFVMKRRKKELGLYSILGMEKKNISWVMGFESLFMALLSIAGGLLLGTLLSQLLFWVLLRMVRYPVMIAMPLSPSALVTTTVFFVVVFFLALLSNLRQVRIANPIALLSGAKQGEKEPKASWLMTALGLVCLGLGYFIAIYFTSPLEALMMFLVAVLLVIIGTFCLFTSGSIFVLKLLRKNKKYYYHPEHFISVSGMIYRMKQNATGLASICILSCMVLVTVTSTVALNVGADDSLKRQYPYDVELSFSDPDEANAVFARSQTLAEECGMQVQNATRESSARFTAEEVRAGDFVPGDNKGTQLPDVLRLIPLADYNRAEGKNAVLNPGEALLLTTGGSYEGDSVRINGISYSLTKLDSMGRLVSGGPDLGRTLVFVLPDMEAMQAVLEAGGDALAGVEINERLRFDLSGDDEAQIRYMELWREEVAQMELGGSRSTQFAADIREAWYATNGGFLYLGMYFGALFLLAATLIIYYKQMSEGYDDAERFEILQKVGMGEAEVKRTINKQILAVFFLPLVVAIVHVSVAMLPIGRVMVLFGITDTGLLAWVGLLTALVYALVYLLVFRRTARTYFQIVRRKSASN